MTRPVERKPNPEVWMTNRRALAARPPVFCPARWRSLSAARRLRRGWESMTMEAANSNSLLANEIPSPPRKGQHMIYFDTTDAAGEILRDGFRDTTGSYMFADLVTTGVWLGDQIMDISEGAVGDQVLRVEFLDDVDLDDFEVVEEGKPYREWIVPAALINDRATVTLMDDDACAEEKATRFAQDAAKLEAVAAEARRRAARAARAVGTEPGHLRSH